MLVPIRILFLLVETAADQKRFDKFDYFRLKYKNINCVYDRMNIEDTI